MTEDKGRQEHVFVDNVLDVVFAYRDDSSFCTNHWHDSIEIIYILKGSTEVFIDQTKYSIMPGEMMVINSGVVHASQTMGNNAIFMQIPIELPGRYIPNIKEVYFDVPLRTEDKVKNMNELRLSYIYEDLLYTDLPLYKILESHGFKNYKLFRRMFHDRYDGETPMQVRENHQKRVRQVAQTLEMENI